MINYSQVRDAVEAVLENREGFANPKLFDTAVRELTGMFCGFAHETSLESDEVEAFLRLVEFHEMTPFINDGKLHNIMDHIDNQIISHPLYYLSEFALMHYRPGKVQAGPGEFFLCFYDATSEFGVDNHIGYDVAVGGNRLELKKLGSNFTTPEIFDKYAASKEVDELMVVKPVSEAKTPKFRSKYVTIDVNNWREAYYHKQQSDGLLNLRLVHA
tara:strand:- start:1910 stop:2554 length:645 start_codon:yes stop_codon:yes gene_type:complete